MQKNIMSKINFYELKDLTTQDRENLLKRSSIALDEFKERVKPVIQAVKEEGDEAIVKFAKVFDKADITTSTIGATEEDFTLAFKNIAPRMIEVLEFCIDNVRRFHEQQMPKSMWMKQMHPGVFAGEMVVPLESVACYVPRGKGSFPSVAMMTAVPAVVAKVKRPIIITPPGPDGNIDDATLVVAKLVGIDKVYKCGGAVGVSAVAYGTNTVDKCQKIVGPGSPFMLAAKELLRDILDPGLEAGPSEVIVLADESANPKVVALDLLIESEHGTDSSAYLVTNSLQIANEVRDAIPDFWSKMGDERRGYSQQVLSKSGGIVVTSTMQEAIDFVNDFAPEHLQIHSKSPYDYLHRIKNAGEILLGEHLPCSVGNFSLGPNAVLPTNFAAKTKSSLGVHDYLKSISIGHVTQKGFDGIRSYVYDFAQYEGFDAHANAVSSIREEALK